MSVVRRVGGSTAFLLGTGTRHARFDAHAPALQLLWPAPGRWLAACHSRLWRLPYKVASIGCNVLLDVPAQHPAQPFEMRSASGHKAFASGRTARLVVQQCNQCLHRRFSAPHERGRCHPSLRHYEQPRRLAALTVAAKGSTAPVEEEYDAEMDAMDRMEKSVTSCQNELASVRTGVTCASRYAGL